MTKGIKGYNTKKDKPDISPIKDKIIISPNPETTAMSRLKDMYFKAMYDLDSAGVITYLDRELIDWSVGEGKPFASFTALGLAFGFYPAEISNIRSGVRKMKSSRIRIMLNKLETLKRKS